MNTHEKAMLIEEVRPGLEGVGLKWEVSGGDLIHGSSIVVWHPEFDKEAGSVYVRFEDIKSGKETAKSILEDIIIDLRRDAQEMTYGY
jgi:hypothetical protein